MTAPLLLVLVWATLARAAPPLARSERAGESAPVRVERLSEALETARARPGLESLPDLAAAKLAVDLRPHFGAPRTSYEASVDGDLLWLRSEGLEIPVALPREGRPIEFGSPQEEAFSRRLAERLASATPETLERVLEETFDGVTLPPAPAVALGFRTQGELRAHIMRTTRIVSRADRSADELRDLLRAGRYTEAVAALGRFQRDLPLFVHPTAGRVLLYELPQVLVNLRRLPRGHPGAKDLPYWNRLARNLSSRSRRTFDGLLPGGVVLDEEGSAFSERHAPAAAVFLEGGSGSERVEARRERRLRTVLAGARHALVGAALFVVLPSALFALGAGAAPSWPSLAAAAAVAALYVWKSHPWGRVSRKALVDTALRRGWLPDDEKPS